MSSQFFNQLIDIPLSSDRLDKMAQNKKLFTVKLDPQELAEFSAATEVFGGRTNTSVVYQFIRTKTAEAKIAVSKEEFDEIVKRKTEEMKKRSKEKAKTSPILNSPLLMRDCAYRSGLLRWVQPGTPVTSKLSRLYQPR